MSPLKDLAAKLANAASNSRHGADHCQIIAVSKRHPSASIATLAAEGQRDFGENYAAELEEKATAWTGDALRWHFIGGLQRNKVKKVVGVAALIHAVDSERLLVEIDKRAAGIDCIQEFLIAVSLAGEEQKTGVTRAQCVELAAASSALSNVQCIGLMTMPPLARDPENNRPYFAELRALRDKLSAQDPKIRELSMGTSGDCLVAASEGATMVRVGTLLFGPRPSGR